MQHNTSPILSEPFFQRVLFAGKIGGKRSRLEIFITWIFFIETHSVGGGQFANITFMEIIRKKIISSLELFRSKEWKQGNRQKMFLNRYRHSFMSKSRCKGKPGEHEVVVYWELINQDLNFKWVTQSWSNNIVQHITDVPFFFFFVCTVTIMLTK